MSKFEAGKTYEGRMICDYDLIERITIAKRTEKSVVTTEGKRLKIHVWDGAELVYPNGQYSMATIIRAERVAA